jgi:hypothetical protein
MNCMTKHLRHTIKNSARTLLYSILAGVVLSYGSGRLSIWAIDPNRIAAECFSSAKPASVTIWTTVVCRQSLFVKSQGIINKSWDYRMGHYESVKAFPIEGVFQVEAGFPLRSHVCFIVQTIDKRQHPLQSFDDSVVGQRFFYRDVFLSPFAFLINSTACTAVAYVFIMSLFLIRRFIRIMKNSCPFCGYSMIGLSSSSRCPECGDASSMS